MNGSDCPGRSETCRRRIHGAIVLIALIVVGMADCLAEADERYGVGDWSESLGNHRAKVRVEQKADAVWVRVPWRRRDAAPERKEIIVVDAATNKSVENVMPVEVNRQFGDLLFQPATVPGDYFIYYMPYRTEGSWYFPSTVYLPPTNKAQSAWGKASQAVAERIRQGRTAGLPAAQFEEFQAINAFHRFDPMEVVAAEEEVKALISAHPGIHAMLFPEDRKHPIRMTDELPLCWVRRGPADRFSGNACRGEFFAFQIGLFAVDKAIPGIEAKFSDLTSDAGTIPAAALRCTNLSGRDWLGRSIHKVVNVQQGKVQPLWFGVDVPPDAHPGVYRGTVTLCAQNLPDMPIKLALDVSDALLEDGGDGEPWRHSRLKWLDSTIGLDDEVFAPYVPVATHDRTIEVLGRSVRLDDRGLFASIASSFTRNVDSVDGRPREILAEPMRFEVEDGRHGSTVWQGRGPRIIARAPGAVTWEATSTARAIELHCMGKMDCDGYTNFRLTVKSTEAAELKDICLTIPLRREIATYMMGLGCKGGYRPKQWQWKWDVARANSQLWIGDVNAGLSCKLKHTEDRWDLFNLQESGIYRDWGNGGRGTCTVGEVGRDQVVFRASTGPRQIAAGEVLQFNFGVLITPVKVLDKGHWQWRYFHRENAAPVAEAAAGGAKIINVHQGDRLNPYINYPFLTTDKLASYAAEAHARQMKVKIYYTIRELSNYTAEFWALRSLGDEVYTVGPGFRLADQFAEKSVASTRPTGSSWLCEHAVTGYVPAWHQHLGNGHYDAAIATRGLSRWHNYYLEGLHWLVRNVGIDGLYLDGIGYDREIMKRVRKVMQRAKPGCLIDFHNGNHFHPEYGMNNCANQFIELLPCVDSLWFGEGFDYNESPDYWLVEMAGIPYGLFGEMLGGGNPWRGMVFGMTNRLGWGGDPRELWKLWDDFGIDRARMIGYWDRTCPVKTGREDVLATVYQREGQTLVAVASWSKLPVTIKPTIDFQRLGLDPAKAALFAPLIAGFQSCTAFKPGEAIAVTPGRGWLLLLDERSHDVPKAADLSVGRKLLQEPFSASPLASEWQIAKSRQPGTTIRVVDGELRIEGHANVAACVERTIPAGARRIVCRINERNDGGASWGPGMTLAWPNGKVLRANLRAEGRFGVDDGARQLLDGINLPDTWVQLAICLDDKEVVVQVSQPHAGPQRIASFPRSEFPGDPTSVRLGKMSPASRVEDFDTLGPIGACAIKDFRVLGE